MAVTTKYDLVVNDVVVQCTFASILYSEKLGHQIYFWHFGHQPLTFVHEELAHILGLYQTPRFVNPMTSVAGNLGSGSVWRIYSYEHLTQKNLTNRLIQPEGNMVWQITPNLTNFPHQTPTIRIAM